MKPYVSKFDGQWHVLDRNGKIVFTSRFDSVAFNYLRDNMSRLIRE